MGSTTKGMKLSKRKPKRLTDEPHGKSANDKYRGIAECSVAGGASVGGKLRHDECLASRGFKPDAADCLGGTDKEDI